MRYLEEPNSYTESRMDVARDLGEREWALLFNWYKVSVLQDEKSSRDCCTTM